MENDFNNIDLCYVRRMIQAAFVDMENMLELLTEEKEVKKLMLSFYNVLSIQILTYWIKSV